MVDELQVGAVKIYAASNSGGAKKAGKTGKTQFTTKTEVPPPLNAIIVFNFFESHPIYEKTQGSTVVFIALQIILLYIFNDQTFLQSHMNELVVGVYF